MVKNSFLKNFEIEIVCMLIAVIIIIIIILNKNKHTFWSKQPVTHHNTNYKEGIISKVPKFNIKFTNSNHYIKYDLEFAKINKFLISNFSSNYNVDSTYLEYIFNKKHSKNISLMEKNNIIGFINSSPINIHYNNKIINFQYVDFLCIKKKYRNRKIATVLISTLINSFSNPNLIILFKIEGRPLPFKHIVKSNFYVKSLLEIKPSSNTNIKTIDIDNFTKIYKYVCDLLKCYKFHTGYSKSDFFEIFIEKRILELYIIKNTSKFDTIVIGKKTTYNINKNIYNCFEIDYILGENRYSKDVIKRLSKYLKNLGYNYIVISGLGSNYNFIKYNNFEKGNTHYYYTYNYNINGMKNYDFCFNIN